MRQLFNWLFRKHPSQAVLPNPQDDLPNRFPVWEAMSELWLERNIDKTVVARILSESPYTVDALNEICLYEVAPHIQQHQDTQSSGWIFDVDWLSNRVVTTIRQPDWRRWVWRRRKSLMATVEKEWNAILSAVKYNRRQSN